MNTVTFPFGPLDLEITENSTTHHHGTTIWPASKVLSSYFLSLARKSSTPVINVTDITQLNRYLRGKFCIELGSGTGLFGICMAILGCEVVVTDQDVDVILENLEANVRRNQLGGNYTAGMETEAQKLNPKSQREVERGTSMAIENENGLVYDVMVAGYTWGNEVSEKLLQKIGNRKIDYLVAGDCVYTMEPLAPFIQSLVKLSDDSTVVLVAMERRDGLVIDEFVRIAKERFVVSKISKSKLDKLYAHESMEVYKLRKKKS
ncbi:hypothetical protein BKA69DRAFT_1126541 [Paraphysoderma sedebokerense]|nr:hypothetical protein BKA69DRAFT_1126541 [Paraphysoderma sedebokerense]